MIAEKLRMIKSKSTSTEPSPTLTNTTNNTNNNINNNNTQVANNQVLNLTPQEISQISIRLQQIRPQIPQIDKLILLHSKLVSPPLNTLEMIKKLTDCRNILVNQIEISVGGGRKNFVMNLSQLNLLIEQVQRLFNNLVSKMKESAGVSPALTTTTATTSSSVTTNTSNITKSTNTTTATTNTNTNNLTSSSALSTTSSLHNSSNTSISSSSKQKTSSLKSKDNSNNNNNSSSLLLQRLSLPPDITNNDFDSWLKRFIAFNSSRKPSIRITNQKHLKQRNRLLNHELKSLNQKYNIQDCGLGTLNVLISTETHRFIFQVAQKYPYDQLIYRIEAKTKSNPNNNKGATTLLPKNREPKTFPLTITSILRNFYE